MNKRDVKHYIEEICNKNWKIPQENNFRTIIPPLRVCFRPNNYRRQMQIKNMRKIFHKKLTHTSTETLKKSSITYAYKKDNLFFQWKYNNQNKNIYITWDENIKLIVGKSTLTAIYEQYKINQEKYVYVIERQTVNEIIARIDEISLEIQEKLDKVLRTISTKFKLKQGYFKSEWVRYEDFIKDEEYIDSLPKESIIHDTVFKKVYGKGIEFIDKTSEPAVRAKTYIKNRAIENVSPEICRVLEKMTNSIDSISIKDYDWLKENINSVNDGIKHKVSIEKLEPEQKFKLTEIFLLKKRIFG